MKKTRRGIALPRPKDDFYYRYVIILCIGRNYK